MKTTRNCRSDEAAFNMSKAAEYWQMVSFYRLMSLDSCVTDPHTEAAALARAWQPLGVLGRVYVAHEGINAQLAVPDVSLDAFKDHIGGKLFVYY